MNREEKFIYAVTITRSGQITIPKDARQQLKLKEGDKLLVYIANNKEIILRKP